MTPAERFMPTEIIHCRTCGREIKLVRLSNYGHLENPRQNHHYALPSRASAETRMRSVPLTSTPSSQPKSGASRSAGAG